MINPSDEKLTINVGLFQQVKEMILTHPETFDMGSVTGRTLEEKNEWTGYYGGTPLAFDPETMQEPSCGSACCIGGWATVLGERRPMASFYKSTVLDIAQLRLGITDEQSDAIFNWRGKHVSVDDVSASEAADMIDRFLANPAAPEFN
jgi:hypothetical protein